MSRSQSPPHSEECEKGILGSMFVEPKIIPQVQRFISSEHFFFPRNAEMFDIFVDCWKTKKPISLISFTQELRDRRALDSFGGASYITEVYNFVPSGANVGYYIDVVLSKARYRNIIETCGASVKKAEQGEDISSIKRELWNMLRKTESQQHHSVTRETVREVKQMIYARQIGTEIGLLTGVAAWDESLRGIFPKRFIVLAARPKVGKTAMIEQAAQFQIKNGHPVLIFERDMSLTDLVGRMACRDANVVYDDFTTGRCGDVELRAVHKSVDAIDTNLLRLYSPSNLTADAIAAIVEHERNEHGIEVFYLDLFQRLKTSGNDRVEGLTAAANTIRDLIQSTGISGVILAEVLKEADKTGRPHSGQFKYCDGLFSACDTSILLWSDEDPKKLGQADGSLRRQRVTFTVDANRGGGVGDSTVYFDREHMKFYAEDDDEI